MIKKFLHILLVCCILLMNMGCSANVKLRRAYVTGKEKSSENYKYGKVGHEDTVQLNETENTANGEEMIDLATLSYKKSQINIGILIELTSNQTQVMPKQIPSSWEMWQGSPQYCSAQEGILCSIQDKKDKVIISFTYQSMPLGDVLISLVFSPLLLGINIPSSLRAVVQPRIFSFDMNKPIAHLQLADDVAYDGSTELIRIKHTITPSTLYLSCKSGKCMVVDDQKQIVNKLVWKQEFVYNTKRLKQLFDEEVELKKQAERAARQLEREKARREAREEQKRMQRLIHQPEVCSALYDTLYVQEGQYTLDPISKVRAVRRWNEYECSMWLQEQISRARY